ncbi:glycosyl transferase family 2 [Aureimonas populi]|uniref:Glycosyl transferase family 2 n=1 Tax=Aureimonas populi TaxID=1701758 RepID=A0ABW5CKJ1_9HYPH|nr:glycosyl transferase family 2 [Aureimonas populi]
MAMLSAFIQSRDEPARLASTLASLVPGAVEGLLRDVTVVDEGMGEQARVVADHAGCSICRPPDLSAALLGAKGEWVLLLSAGARLGQGWTDAVALHIASGRGRPASFSRSRFLAFALPLRGPASLASGVLAPKRLLVEARGASPTLADLARSWAAVRIDVGLTQAAPERR